MRYRGFLAVAVLILLAAAVGGAAAQSQGEADPTLLKEIEIRDSLLEKVGNDAVGIRVTVDGKKAILTGKVPTRAAQELSEEVALNVEGIKSVDNRLKVVPPGGETTDQTLEQEMADARLETKVKRHLYSEIGKRARHIEVEVTDGIVSLRGEVPDESRKQLALDTAGKTEGVKQVIDLLRVKS
ncbi:MAG TPA: BON domain-containing protein [Thermoanaerobaculia bacterium]|nr:BON domain-containing protein [Thermoanaerobaculia bacterium]